MKKDYHYLINTYFELFVPHFIKENSRFVMRKPIKIIEETSLNYFDVFYEVEIVDKNYGLNQLKVYPLRIDRIWLDILYFDLNSYR